MTLEKAHLLLNLMIKHKRDAREGLLDPKQLWNRDDDVMRGAASTMADGIENDIEWLETIKKQLPTPPKCSHPKKMQDVTKDGQRYCMNCNADL